MKEMTRGVSEIGFYHVMARGVNKQIIFNDDNDKRYFLGLIKKKSEIVNIEIHAFCIMDNHFHMLIRSEKQKLSTFMQMILTEYAKNHNKKVGRIGHLFENRFKSEVINDEKYYLTVLRYILQNPEKAFISSTEKYRWSSISAYRNNSFVRTDFAENLIGSKKELMKYLLEKNQDECMDLPLTKEEEDIKAKIIIDYLCRNLKNDELNNMSKERRNLYIREMKKSGISNRKISNMTGIGIGIVQRA